MALLLSIFSWSFVTTEETTETNQEELIPENGDHTRKVAVLKNDIAVKCQQRSLGIRRQLSTVETNALKSRWLIYDPFVEALFVILAALVILWDFMMFNTMMNFHTITEKVLGCTIALALWLFFYKGIYYLPLTPGLPRDGPLFRFITPLGIRIQGKNCKIA